MLLPQVRHLYSSSRGSMAEECPEVKSSASTCLSSHNPSQRGRVQNARRSQYRGVGTRHPLPRARAQSQGVNCTGERLRAASFFCQGNGKDDGLSALPPPTAWLSVWPPTGSLQRNSPRSCSGLFLPTRGPCTLVQNVSIEWDSLGFTCLYHWWPV